MSDVDVDLRRALDELVAMAPHDPDLAGTVRRRSFWRRLTVGAPLAAAVAVLAVLGSLLVLRPVSGPVNAGGPVSACRPLTSAVLPTWARGGFSASEPVMPYVSSDNGLFVAIIFGTPLTAPPADDHNNKILWVPRPADPRQPSMPTGEPLDRSMHIQGSLEGTSTTMATTVAGGPGPSIIDMPAAGCWVLHLTWGTYTDTIALAYATSATPAAPTSGGLPSR